MEQFIERSNALLAARPDTARVSTRFTHKKVNSSGDRVDPSATPMKVVIKTYDPVSGFVYKFKARKANELSRVLASLGPQNFEFGSGKKRGLASLMSNVEPTEEAEPKAPSQTTASATTQTSEAKLEKAQQQQPAHSSKASKSKKKSKRH